MKTSCDLISLGQRGFIPGPYESEEAFFHRVIPSIYPTQCELIKKLYQIDPDWVQISYGNKRLMPWEGGCTEIGDRVRIQLRKEFAGKKRFLFYDKEELLAHELVHVARSAFNEPVFEEFLAYQTSSSKWRRFLGPIFRTPKETCFFLIMLLLTIGGEYFFQTITGPLLFLGAIIGYGFFRLISTHRIFNRALKRLSLLLGSKEKALASALHLTDEEVHLFSKSSLEEIKSYIEASKSLRWEQFKLLFFQEKT